MDNIGHHIAQGENLLRAGRLEEALDAFSLVIEQRPDSHRAIYFSALAHLKMNHETTALLQFVRALELSPDNPDYLSDLAVTKVRLGDSSGAMRDLDRCVQLDPGNSYRYSLRAFVRNGMGDVEGAITDYRKAVELDPEDPIAHNNLGLAEEKLGYGESASGNFAKADRLSGIGTAPADHTIDLTGKKGRREADPAGTSSPDGYWSILKRLLTDGREREEFMDFIGSMFKSSAK